MKRLTMLHGTKEEFRQCVITEDSKDYFEGLGFVDSVEKLSEPEAGSDYETELRDKIKALGGKPGGRAKIETLEAQLAELEADDAESGDDSNEE